MEVRQKFEIKLIILSLVFVAIAACLFVYTKKLNGPVIRSDGAGYYAYLSSIVIEHDLQMNLSKENSPDGLGGINIYPPTGKLLDKYPIGVAMLQSPFFLLANGLATHLGYKQTGYTFPYQVANALSGIFYLCLGTFFLLLSLLVFFDKKIAYLTLALILFGTNVFHYGTYDGSFSHIYTFSLVSIYLWGLVQYQKKLTQGFSFSSALFFGVILGLITITRVPNAMFGIFLLGLMSYKLSIKKDWASFLKESLITASAYFLIISPQLVYWYMITGKLIVYSYQNEYFNFMRPRLYDFLFSIRKGLFFYEPLTLIAFLGLPIFFKKEKVFTILITIVICLQLYLCASWNTWWFGGSFGSRPFVDVMPFLALPLASIVTWLIRQRSWRFTVKFAAFFMGLNLIFMYSYWEGYIPFDGANTNTFVALPHELFRILPAWGTTG